MPGGANLMLMPSGSLMRSRKMRPARSDSKEGRLVMAVHSVCQSLTRLPEETVVSPGYAW